MFNFIENGSITSVKGILSADNVKPAHNGDPEA